MKEHIYKVVPKDGREMKKKTCKDCAALKFPACDLGIPCCRCGEEWCNSRQPCPKKEEEE